MPTTTFADIKLTEKIENYRYENDDYNFSQGDVISIPLHTANRFVNGWDKAEWEKEPYEVRDADYDDVLCRIRGESSEPEKASKEELSYDELQDIAQENDIAANQSAEDIKAELDEKGVDY